MEHVPDLVWQIRQVMPVTGRFHQYHVGVLIASTAELLIRGEARLPKRLLWDADQSTALIVRHRAGIPAFHAWAACFGQHAQQVCDELLQSLTDIRQLQDHHLGGDEYGGFGLRVERQGPDLTEARQIQGGV